MKVTREEVKFEPVTLVLESQAEVDLLVVLAAPTVNILIKELALKLGFHETYFLEKDLPYNLYNVLLPFASNEDLGNDASRHLKYSVYN